MVAHHVSGALAERAVELGFVPSVPARSRDLAASSKVLGSSVVESDFLDDPRRPGAVVAPWSIARTIARLLREGALSEADARRALVENPARLYGVEPPA